MKRNIVPLLGIAFVVAIISTGVFYGLFAGKLRSSSELPGYPTVVAARDLDRGTVIQRGDLHVTRVPGALTGGFSKPEDATGATLLTALKANEPLLEERVTPAISERAKSGGAVPDGMRAMTMHVFQSESLLNMLRPGSRIDLQAVADRSGSVELRTVLQNVQVLAVSPPDNNGNRPAGAAVTVLVRARDADLVALADSGSRVRVTLRNPSDDETISHRPVKLGALFSLRNTQGTGRTEERTASITAPSPVLRESRGSKAAADARDSVYPTSGRRHAHARTPEPGHAAGLSPVAVALADGGR